MDSLDSLLQSQPPQDINLSTESIEGESVVHEGDDITFFSMPVLIVFIDLGFVGNILILYAVCAVKQFNRAENMMLANLSATSVANIVSTILLYVQETDLINFSGPLYCKLYPGIHLFMVVAEGFTMMCISLERTQGVRFPLVRATKSSAMKKIGVIWCLALLLDMPCGLLFYEYDPAIESFIKCHNTKQIFGSWIPYVIYVTINFSLRNFLPAFWLVRDWIRLVSQLRFLIACQTLSLQSEYRKSQKRLIRHAIIFTSIFIAVKLPLGFYFLLYKLPPQLLNESAIGWVKTWNTFFFGLQMLHGCFYPFIIFALSTDIRKCLFRRRCASGRLPVPRY